MGVGLGGFSPGPTPVSVLWRCGDSRGANWGGVSQTGSSPVEGGCVVVLEREGSFSNHGVECEGASVVEGRFQLVVIRRCILNSTERERSLERPLRGLSLGMMICFRENVVARRLLKTQ